MRSPAEGARTRVWWAREPSVERGGLYYECRPRAPNRLSRDEALARALWDRCAAWVDRHACGRTIHP